jgi:hypothetical protein
MKLSYKDDLSKFTESVLKEHYWESEKYIKIRILEIISCNYTPENHDFLLSIVENETDEFCAEKAIYSLEKSESSIDFLVDFYTKTHNEDLKDSIIEVLESISISSSLNVEKQNVLNKLFRTKYHYEISHECVKINLDTFVDEFQKRVAGDSREIWLDLNDSFCIHFNSFQMENGKLDFQLLVVSKTNNYIPNDYFIPKGWMFMVIYSFELSEIMELEQTILSNVMNIIDEILSFRNLKFEVFILREAEFKQLLFQIHYDFREAILYEGYNLKESDVYDIYIDEYLELLWLFKESIDFDMYVRYGLDLLLKTDEKFNYEKRLNYLNYLLTTTNNGGVLV